MMNIILRFLFCFIYLSVNENSGEKTERRKAMKVSVPGAVSEDQIVHDGNKKQECRGKKHQIRSNIAQTSS